MKMRVLRINKQYVNVSEKISSQPRSFVFAPLFDTLLEEIRQGKIADVYPLYDTKDKDVREHVLRNIRKHFLLDESVEVIDSTSLPESIKGEDVVIRLANNSINDLRIIDFIGKLTKCFGEVFLANIILDNPVANIFYIVCKGTTPKQSLPSVSQTDFMTNINENVMDIYEFIYFCIYSWIVLLKDEDGKALKKFFGNVKAML